MTTPYPTLRAAIEQAGGKLESIHTPLRGTIETWRIGDADVLVVRRHVGGVLYEPVPDPITRIRELGEAAKKERAT